MKAGILEKIEHLVVKRVPDLALQRWSVILKMKICSICSTDIRICRYGHSRVEPPQILGYEISGEVEVADVVTGYKVGDRLAVTPRIACGDCFYCRKGQHIYCQNSRTFGYELSGGYAQYVLIPESRVKHGVLIDSIREAFLFAESKVGMRVAISP
ncbi:alcohol dehydrogenase catalytic domain-containing protein [Chloroflexota bacterium]